MKKLLASLFLTLALLLPANSWALQASGFKGVYDILSQQNTTLAPLPFFLFDNDTVGNIWAKYGEGDLPADLERLRHEPAILAGFSNRSTLFFTLEKAAVIADNFISVPGGNGEQLELRRRPDGQFDMAVGENNRVSLYLLAAPRPLPDSR